MTESYVIFKNDTKIVVQCGMWTGSPSQQAWVERYLTRYPDCSVVYLSLAGNTLDFTRQPKYFVTEKEIEYQLSEFQHWLNIVIRPKRDSMMTDFQWRIERNKRESRMGSELTDDIAKLDLYMKTLADFPATFVTISANPIFPQFTE